MRRTVPPILLAGIILALFIVDVGHVARSISMRFNRDRDSHGCWMPMAETWDAEIGACVGEWPDDPADAQRAAALAAAHIGSSWGLTIEGMDAWECAGCFTVQFSRPWGRHGEEQFEVALNNWAVVPQPEKIATMITLATDDANWPTILERHPEFEVGPLRDFHYPDDWITVAYTREMQVMVFLSDGGEMTARSDLAARSDVDVREQLTRSRISTTHTHTIDDECALDVLFNGEDASYSVYERNTKHDDLARAICSEILWKLDMQLPRYRLALAAPHAWQTHEQNALGIAVGLPNDWVTLEHTDGITISHPHHGALFLTREERTLEEFIAGYNNVHRDDDGTPFSYIAEQHPYRTRFIRGTEIISSGDTGIVQAFLYLPQGDHALVMAYHDDDPEHRAIAATLRFLE